MKAPTSQIHKGICSKRPADEDRDATGSMSAAYIRSWSLCRNLEATRRQMPTRAIGKQANRNVDANDVEIVTSHPITAK